MRRPDSSGPCVTTGSPPRVRRTIRWVPLALGLLLPSCTSTPSPAFQRSFDQGKVAHAHGRTTEAVDAFTRAAREATRVKDRDEALFLLGSTLRGAGRPEEARAAWRHLVDLSPEGPRAPRAAYELVRLELETLSGPAMEGAQGSAPSEALERLILRYPDEGFAASASRHLAEQWRTHLGLKRATEELERLSRSVGSHRLAQTFDYERAVLLEELGQPTDARDLFVATARRFPYPFGSLTDDALYRASELEEALGHPREAVALLEELLAPREQALVGSYDRPRFPAARLRIARLQRDALGSPAEALRNYEALLESFPASRQWDDAAWEAAQVEADRGRIPEACALLECLKRGRADSRFVPCVGLLCAPLASKEVKGAQCADYIARSRGTR